MNKFNYKTFLIGYIFFCVTMLFSKDNLNEHFKVLGDQSFNNGNYVQAIKYFIPYKKSTSIPLMKFYASEYLLKSYLKLQEIKKAERELKFMKKFKNLDKENDIKFFTAELLLRNKEYEKAINLYDEVIDSLDANDELFFQTLSHLGNTYITLQRWTSAILTFKKLYNNGANSTHEISASKKIIFAHIMNKEFKDASTLLKEIPQNITKTDLIEYKLLRICLLIKQEIEIPKAETLYLDIKGSINNNLHLTYITALEFSKYFKKQKNIEKSIAYLVDVYNFIPTKIEKRTVLLKIVKEFIDIKQHSKAIEKIKMYLAIQKDEQMKLQMARLYFKIKDFKNSLKIYKELSNSKKISTSLRITIVYEVSSIYERMKEYDNAEQQLHKLLPKLNNINQIGDVLYKISNLYYTQKKFLRAERDLQLIDSKYKNMEKVLSRIINIQILTENYEKGLVSIKEFLNKFPKSTQVQDFLFQHAFLLYKLNKINETQQELLSLLEKYPKHKYAPQSLLVLGEITYNANNYDKALELFAKLAKTYPESVEAPNALYKKLLINSMLAKDKVAMENASILVKKYPKSKYAQNAFFRMSDYFYNKNLPTNAINALRNIVLSYKKKTMSQNDIDIIGKAMFEIAYIKKEKINYDEALYEIEKFENLYTKSSSYADVMFLKGNILYNKGNYEESILAYKNALERKPDETFKIKCKNSIALSSYSHSFQANGEDIKKQYLNEAIKQYSEILKMQRCPIQIKIKNLYMLGKIHSIIKDLQKATEYYNQANDEYLLNLSTKGPRVDLSWFVKSVNALIEIYNQDENIENIKKIIKCHKLLIKMKIGSIENHNIQIKKLKEKISLK